MALSERTINVAIALPSGTVTLDASLDLRIQIHKDALGIQQSCYIDVFNLSQTLRQSLLSQFTLWNKRQIQSGQTTQAQYITVTISAGYTSSSQSTVTTIYVGEIVTAEPISGPPKIGVRITCSTQMNAKLQWVSNVPTQTTFKAYAEWVGQQLGAAKTICKTSYDDTTITNPSASTMVAANLLFDLQNAYRPNVAAFIDNDTLYVKDQKNILTSDTPYTISEFIDTPLWTEWGSRFRTLFDPQIVLAAPVTLNSKMNPSLNQTYVVTGIDYDLTSRQTPFYVSATANPVATS